MENLEKLDDLLEKTISESESENLNAEQVEAESDKIRSITLIMIDRIETDLSEMIADSERSSGIAFGDAAETIDVSDTREPSSADIEIPIDRIDNRAAEIEAESLRHSYRTIEIISSLSEDMADYEGSGDGLPAKNSDLPPIEDSVRLIRIKN